MPALGLLLLGTVAFAGIGLLMAGTLRAEANLAAANGLFLVLLFLGGMAYPLAKLPGARRRRSPRLLPAAALSDTRALGALDRSAFPTGQLVVLIAWAVARAARRRPLLPLGGVDAARSTVDRGRAGDRSTGGVRGRCAATGLAVDAAAHDAVARR